MSANIVLVPVNGSKSDAGSLHTALCLTKIIGGHIRVAFIRPKPEISSRSFHEELYPGAFKAIVAAIRRQWDETSKKSQHQFETWRTANQLHSAYEPAPGMTVSAEWQEFIGAADDVLQGIGLLADVIVLPRPNDAFDADSYGRFETGLLQTGRPVVLAPHRQGHDFAIGRILVAWNRSPQAARAVSSALPLLRHASDVGIVLKPEGRLSRDSVAVLVDYLKWHGVRATIVANPKKSNPAPEAILAAAKAFRANLLVMGAYTHSRLRETILGGATLHVSSNATIPVWFSH